MKQPVAPCSLELSEETPEPSKAADEAGFLQEQSPQNSENLAVPSTLTGLLKLGPVNFHHEAISLESSACSPQNVIAISSVPQSRIA